MKLNTVYQEFPSIFRSRDAPTLGITQHALKRDSRFSLIYRGVRVNFRDRTMHPTPSWADEDWRLRAVRLRAGLLVFPEAVGSSITAALLYGLPIAPHLVSDQLHLACVNPGTHSTDVRIYIHRFKAIRFRTWFDLRLIAPDQLFLELAPILTERELIVLGDAIVGNWHGPPLCSLSDLQSAASKSSYLRNRKTVMSALRLIRENVDSPQETDLRLWCLVRGFPEPLVHPQIYSEVLERIIEPDLGFKAEKLALEYEGDHHRESKNQWARDIERDEAVRAEGWEVFRVTSRTDRRQLEAKIRNFLRSRKTPDSPSQTPKTVLSGGVRAKTLRKSP